MSTRITLVNFSRDWSKLFGVNNWRQGSRIRWNKTVESILFGLRQFFKETYRKNDSIKAKCNPGHHLLTSNSVNYDLYHGKIVNKELDRSWRAKETSFRDQFYDLYFWLNNKPRRLENWNRFKRYLYFYFTE